MTVPASSIGATGLPVVNQAVEPAWVRRGSAATQKAYDTALAFEQTLVEQLARSMTASSGIGGEAGEGEGGGEEGSGEAQSAPLSSMLPQALAAGVINGGGLGLAAELTHSLEGVGAGAAAPTAGTPAPAGAGGTATAATSVEPSGGIQAGGRS